MFGILWLILKASSFKSDIISFDTDEKSASYQDEKACCNSGIKSDNIFK